ncbi:hypothetical protein QJS66_14220 [Kocuria rhizophila]|nr:hypothetical protein QJS66_14220 [Kocuria rhizophila]
MTGVSAPGAAQDRPGDQELALRSWHRRPYRRRPRSERTRTHGHDPHPGVSAPVRWPRGGRQYWLRP